MKRPRATALKLGALAVFLAVGVVSAARAGDDVEALAKQSQNPVAAMVSVPLRNNFNFGMGPDKEMGYNLNIQPVIPLALSSNWNYIVRPIVPILDIPLGAANASSAWAIWSWRRFSRPTTISRSSGGWAPWRLFPPPARMSWAMASGTSGRPWWAW